MDARLVQGLHDYIVGSLPWTYRTLGFLVGIHGDKERASGPCRMWPPMAATTGWMPIFLGALYRRENQTSRAVPIIQDLIHRFPRNYILRLELSQMYSMAGDRRTPSKRWRSGGTEEQPSPGYDRVPWEKIYFQEGTSSSGIAT